MKESPIKKLIPYFVAVIIFLIITMLYFSPLFQGKKLLQGDITRHRGMSKEIMDHREKTGEEALWTNSMFGGMPAYQISVKYKSNLISYVDKIFRLGLPNPAGYVFLYFLGFFVLLLILGVDPWISIAGAIAFALSSYFFIILEAGHNSKAHAIAYMAPVLASIILSFRGKILLGGILTALFLALELNAGHPQISYYLMLIVLVLGIFELIDSIKTKTFFRFLKIFAVLVVAVIIAVLTNITSLWSTYEYGKYTIRGKSELSIDKENKTSGLDKDYATDWSYGIAETFSLMIPNVKGGETESLGNNEAAMKNVDRQLRQAIAGSNQYWGDQPFTSGPVYVGAIVCFLFILGLFIVEGRLKWILLTATILSVFLAWGKNFMPLSDFFLDYFPGYNKFRAVSMTMVIAELCIPILAILAVNKVFKTPEIIKEKRKQFFIAFGLTGGLALIFYLFPSIFSFLSSSEIVQFNEYSKQGIDQNQLNMFISELENARITIFKADAIRSFLFILFAAIVIWFYSSKIIGKQILIPIIILLFIVDLTPVCYRYLNKDNFQRKTKVEKPFSLTKADNDILKDNSLDYRVLNLAVNTFNNASTSYFHKSIGGYHGAKLRRYQELISYDILPEIQRLKTTLSEKPDYLSISSTLSKSTALNMLNTKYIIVNPSTVPMVNNFALGNVWFVEKYKIVENADAEIADLKTIEPSKTAIINKKFEEYLQGFKIGDDSLSGIILTDYKPNHLTYKSETSKDRLAVFSEIFYDKGWNAYIDGELSPHIRADYVLRAMIIPTGKHLIEFKFEPRVYASGEIISFISSLLLLLIIVFVIIKQVQKSFFEKKNKVLI
ncbi:MAG: hypothetical protein JEY97_00165 [Bacteroidales bacterium]|nr:hypothetical protein [Bacteroidales bacterium]